MPKIQGHSSRLLTLRKSSKRVCENVGTSSAAHLVPADILIYIFALLRDSLSCWLCDQYSSTISWLSVSHVCRWWRQVALEAAGLWTAVPSTSPQAWKHFIIRSQEAPLQVALYLFKRAEVQASKPVLEQMHRIKRLHLRGPQIFNTVSYLSDQAPLLEMLILGADEHQSSRKNPKMITDEVLSSVFAGHVPNLHMLCLIGIPIRADSPLFSEKLTRLELHHGCAANNVAVSLPLATLIETLARLPLLERLVLGDVIVDPVSSHLLEQSLIGLPTANMAHLKDVGIHTDFPFIHKALMTRICAPRLSHLRVETTVKTRDELSHPFLPSLLSWSEDPASTLALNITGYLQQLTVTSGPTSVLTEKGEEALFKAPLIASIYLDMFPVIPEGLCDLCAQLPLHQVRSLQLFYCGYVTDWTPILLETCTVEDINVAFFGWKELLQGLTASVANDDGTLHLLCPKLKKLQFTSFGYAPKSDHFFEALAIAVEVRRAMGSELEDIVFDGEAIPCRDMRDIAALRQRRMPSLRQRVLRRLAFK